MRNFWKYTMKFKVFSKCNKSSVCKCWHAWLFVVKGCTKFWFLLFFNNLILWFFSVTLGIQLRLLLLKQIKMFTNLFSPPPKKKNKVAVYNRQYTVSDGSNSKIDKDLLHCQRLVYSKLQEIRVPVMECQNPISHIR